MSAAADVVQRQVDAYNARDLERFAATQHLPPAQGS
jgi:hypothetical protein